MPATTSIQSSATAAKQPTAKAPRKTAAPKKAAAKLPARKVAPRKSVASKTAARPDAKAPAKPAVKAVVRAVKIVQKAVAPSKIKAPKKPKLVRDSFTMPKDEYQAIDSLKQRATSLLHSVKKSELLRAGIMALSAIDDKGFAAILAKVPALKTGRPGRG